MEVFKIEILQKNFITPGTNRGYSEREKYLHSMIDLLVCKVQFLGRLCLASENYS